jgi:adenosylmethionine-8-amino-7-oxononanoate aminotransferase
VSNLLLHFSKSEIDDLLVLERGEGPYVVDSEGRRYIDALSSLFCAQIGYSHGEEMAAAATKQLTTLAFNTNWGTAHPAALELAERIAAGDRGAHQGPGARRGLRPRHRPRV